MATTFTESQQELKDTLSAYFEQIYDSQEIVSSTTPATEEEAKPDLLIFSNNLDTLFEKVKKRTAYRARTMFDDKGNSLFDAYALTDDERDYFDEAIKPGSDWIFNELTKRTKNVVNAYLFDAMEKVDEYDAAKTYLQGDTVYYQDKLYKCKYDNTTQVPTDTYYWEEQPLYMDAHNKILYWMDPGENYNVNTFPVIDGAITESLVLYVLKEWYKTVGLYNDSKLTEDEYFAQIGKIKTNLWKRTKSITRPSRYY